MRRKLRVAAVDESSRVALPPRVVKSLSAAVDNCDPRFAAGAVKADSHAQRGRSEAERLDGDNAKRTVEGDGPPNRAGFQRECCREQHCESRRNRAQESTAFCYALGRNRLQFGAEQRGVSDHAQWPRT